MFNIVITILLMIIVLPSLFIIFFILYLYRKNTHQNQSSVKRTHPILGGLRYLFEKVGPEMRQYWFEGNKEGRPIDRDTAETINKAGKYASTVKGFGSLKDFSGTDFYLANSMFPKNKDEIEADNSAPITTFTYSIQSDGLLTRKESRNLSCLNPWLLTEKHEIIIGENCKNPFYVKGLIGISAMSFGALSSNAVQALAQGVAIAGGSWMNTGEGGVSPFHLSKIYTINECHIPAKGLEKEIYDFIKEHICASNFEITKHFSGSSKKVSDDQLYYNGMIRLLDEMSEKGYLMKRETPLIFQIGSGMFGARDAFGNFSEPVFLENALRPEVKAIEIKLAQGAKVRGGKLPAAKNTPFIAKIRGVEPNTTVESPNRFQTFYDIPSLCTFIQRLRLLSGKPVGIKMVVGHSESLRELASYIKETNIGPDFITIDGGEGGTGATYQEMADSLGLPIYSAILIADQTLKKFGVRDRVKLIASGMLATSDKMAIALSLGADLINVARAAMNTIGCINALKCHTNECPTGVTTHKPELMNGLVVEEKRFRTANYLVTMREGLFMLGSSCGLSTPTDFNLNHVTLKEANGLTKRMDSLIKSKVQQGIYKM